MTVNTNRGKITATKGVLNYILLTAHYAAERCEEEGLISFFRRSRRIFVRNLRCIKIIRILRLIISITLKLPYRLHGEKGSVKCIRIAVFMSQK